MSSVVTSRAGIPHARRIVVKVGSSSVSGENVGQIGALVDALAAAHGRGSEVILVSSGAIATGIPYLNLDARPTDLATQQAAAAVGQNVLIFRYQESLDRYRIVAGQILLTAGDFDNRARYLNVRNTILTLFEYAALPIINENDTVSVAEIKFGDNDHLAAMVTNLLRAPLLILLTNVDGLYSGDPRANPDAMLLATVPHIDSSVTGLAADTKSDLGTGGMASKLKAARLATAAGEAVVMANGSLDGILDRIFAAEPVGTLFLPHGEDVPSWKRWVGYTARPKGVLTLDAGACRAVVEQGKSLLPVGVTAVSGEFGKGDVVSVVDESGAEVARGLSNYSSTDAARIRGQKAAGLPYGELIHRDNLVVIGK